MEAPTASLGTEAAFRALRRRRFYLIAIIWLGSVGVTWVLKNDPGWVDVATFKGAVFAGWVASLAFFTVIGVAVALVSLARPEEDAFDSRARILFRHQSGKHIDYIVSKMKGEFEHYSERYEVVIAIVDSFAKPAAGSQPAGTMFRLQETCSFVQKAYIDDITSIWNASVDYAEICLPPAAKESNKFVRLRINKKPVGAPELFANTFRREFQIVAEPYSRAEVDFEMFYWVDVGERNSFLPIRYTQELTLIFANKTDAACSVAFHERGSVSGETIKLASGEERKIQIKDLQPNNEAYWFTVAS